jgi:hypothetical protein
MNIFKALALKWVLIFGITKAMKKAAEHMEKKERES